MSPSDQKSLRRPVPVAGERRGKRFDFQDAKGPWLSLSRLPHTRSSQGLLHSVKSTVIAAPVQPFDIHHELEPNLAGGMHIVLVRLSQSPRTYRQASYATEHEEIFLYIQATSSAWRYRAQEL